jgi:beta-1,3-glucuronyltransferase
VSALLNRSHVPYVHLLGPRPPTHLDRRSGRGVSNRLKALEYLRETYSNTSQEGVIYFADDDNAYDIRIFDEIRDTKMVSMFPVGLIAKLGLSTPILNNKTAEIIGFHDPFISRRKYAVDMAGFAVNLQLFLSKPKATMPYKVGYEEDYFIKSLGVQFSDLEPKAGNCTQVCIQFTVIDRSLKHPLITLRSNRVFETTPNVTLKSSF